MRLVTRADFDGIVCGSLITAVEHIDDYLFVEPKFMQDGVVDIRSGDIIANLPYHPNCTLWFDHHFSNNAHGFDRPIVAGRGGFRLAPRSRPKSRLSACPSPSRPASAPGSSSSGTATRAAPTASARSGTAAARASTSGWISPPRAAPRCSPSPMVS